MKILIIVSIIAIYTSILIAIDNTQNQTDLNLIKRIECLEMGLVYVGDDLCARPTMLTRI